MDIKYIHTTLLHESPLSYLRPTHMAPQKSSGWHHIQRRVFEVQGTTLDLAEVQLQQMGFFHGWINGFVKIPTGFLAPVRERVQLVQIAIS